MTDRCRRHIEAGRQAFGLEGNPFYAIAAAWQRTWRTWVELGTLNGQTGSIAPREGLWQWRFVLLGLISLLLAACANSKMADMFNDAGVKGEQLTRQAASGRKVALLLPLSASGETKRIAAGDEAGCRARS